MEFGEKLQALRKSKAITQEELAEYLHVSRTAVSKWESGRGYPSIDSIKDIASFFSVTIDELLSSEKILSLAEKENKANVQKICDLLFGIADLFTLMLIVLPIYPNTVDGHIYSVNLFSYAQISTPALFVYWLLFVSLASIGIFKIVLTQADIHKGQKIATCSSLFLGIFAILFLSLTRQVYATILLFALLVIKGLLYLKNTKI